MLDYLFVSLGIGRQVYVHKDVYKAVHRLYDPAFGNAKITAIKLVRSVYDLGLKEAKDLVELCVKWGETGNEDIPHFGVPSVYHVSLPHLHVQDVKELMRRGVSKYIVINYISRMGNMPPEHAEFIYAAILIMDEE